MLPNKMTNTSRPTEERRPKERRAKTPEQALSALMRLCARAEKSESDARRLMRGWGVPEADAEKVLARLIQERFIDDARYTDAFVREKLRLSGWGKYKLRAALQRKGIAREIVDEALSRIDRTGMTDRLAEQLARKARNTRAQTPYELKTKLIRYGLSLGYDYETVLDTVSQFVKETDRCNEF